MDFWRDPWACLELVTRLAGWSLAVSSAEWLVAHRVYADDAVLGWPLLRRRSRLQGEGPVARALGVVFCGRGFQSIHLSALFAGLVLLFLPRHPVACPAALFVGTLTACLTHLRQFGVGVIGADRMRLCVLGAVTLRAMAPDSELAARAALWFVAGQCVLAYVTSGVMKCRVLEWRHGTAIGLILRQNFMGHAGLANWLAVNPWRNRALTWTVMALETLFPLALLGGAPVAAGFVVIAWLMHLGIGHFMGLAPFLWAFLASYPAVVFASVQLQAWLMR